MTTIVTGDKELDRALRHLEGTPALRVTSSGIRAALSILVRRIRQAMPSRYKEARKAIRSRFRRTRSRGIIRAKAGAGVAGDVREKRPRRPGRGGVGIGARNIHWLIMGTKDRHTKAGKYTGRMPRLPAVKRGAARALGEIGSRMFAAMKKQLERELAKAK